MEIMKSILFAKYAPSRIVEKCCGLGVLQMQRVWKCLPPRFRSQSVGRAYGRQLHRVVGLYASRKQFVATFFLRNRAELEMLRRIVDQSSFGARVNLCVLACSKGAEVYSFARAIRSARPDLDLNITAIDISQEIVDFAAKGIYSLDRSDAVASASEETVAEKNEVSRNTSRDQNAWMFERMSQEEIESMFEVEGNRATIQPWLRQGITWLSADAGDPDLQSAIGLQNVVIANRFLCHMKPEAARSCLQNIGGLVKPGGYLFVSGIDLDVRTSVATEMGWKPVTDLLREVHDGDASIRSGWPMEYWGLEPLDDERRDWQIRYASVFQIGNAPCDGTEKSSFALSQRGENKK